MADRDIYPSIRDERKTFRYGTNRMVELALRHELDDVARKSLDEIAVKKERQRLKPLDNEELTSRSVFDLLTDLFQSFVIIGSILWFLKICMRATNEA